MNVRGLLAWFRKESRDLPWRRTRDPYSIWVSEIMLQQTQIATVIPYYERWMKRFPTIRALAKAPLDDVLKMWEGLGYYARARNLHKSARMIRRFPTTRDEIRRLPGVGDYTAAAIASIAFGEKAAVFDGNVRRVLSRLLRKDVAEPLPVRGKPGDYNQALMELGQRICTPRAPKCLDCPLAKDCLARASGEEERWPSKKESKPVPHKDVAIGVCWKDDRVYVQRREEEGLLGGLWEFPGGKREKGESYEECLHREFLEETGMGVEAGPHLITVKHRYSHFSVELHTFHCHHRRGKGSGRWVTLEEMDDLAFPAANKKIIEALKADRLAPGLWR